MNRPVLILGGYGVFGSRIARPLIAAGEDVVIAGRSAAKAEAFCAEHGGRALALDIAGAGFAEKLAVLDPFVVIDAAGPFQDHVGSYAAARAAVTAGAHYLDLSDDAAFTGGIAVLNAAAQAAGVAVLSGVSSVPALSSAVVAELSAGMADLHLIETVILPGNRAPRGLSVMRSILGQVGRPIPVWRGSQGETVRGWGDTVRVDLETPGGTRLSRRRASPIGAPDLALFPKHFGAQTVAFRAGLELGVMHDGLAWLGRLPRLGLMGSLAPLAGELKWITDRLEPLGSDRGGMRVRVIGAAADGTLERRDWTLIVGAGDGPSVPGVPARILLEKLRRGEVSPGARPCLAEFSLAEAEATLGTLDAQMGVAVEADPPLFQRLLGPRWADLPAPLRELHRVGYVRRWRGRADIERGRGWLARIAGAIAGFPPAGKGVPVAVEMRRTRAGETWIRRFGRYSFRSYLSPDGAGGSARLRERFGLLSFAIRLDQTRDALGFPVVAGRCLGIPLPSFLRPVSETREHVDAKGRASFEVSIRLPIAGFVAAYQGWLEPVETKRSSPLTSPAPDLPQFLSQTGGDTDESRKPEEAWRTGQDHD